MAVTWPHLSVLIIWKAVLSLFKISHQVVRKYDALDFPPSFLNF